MTVTPYLTFDGRCEEALAFYKSALGAEVEMLMRFGESPDPSHCPPDAEDKVMHASFRVAGTTVMESDGRCQGQPTFEGFALSIIVADEAEAERRIASLAEGGQVQIPLDKTFFAKRLAWSPTNSAMDG